MNEREREVVVERGKGMKKKEAPNKNKQTKNFFWFFLYGFARVGWYRMSNEKRSEVLLP